MTINMLGGNDKCVGVCTTGGTESILMTVKAYRDYAKEVKGITEPNMYVIISIRDSALAFIMFLKSSRVC